VKVLVFVLCFALFLASMWLFALAFQVPGYEIMLFIAGILGVSVSFAIPFTLLHRAS